MVDFVTRCSGRQEPMTIPAGMPITQAIPSPIAHAFSVCPKRIPERGRSREIAERPGDVGGRREVLTRR